MKIWEKPELIVLLRSNPEESILDVCKGGGNWFGAKDGLWNVQIHKEIKHGKEKRGCGSGESD